MDQKSKSTIRWAVNASAWNPDDSELTFLLSLLTSTERHACRAFKFQSDQKRALVSRLIQRKACCRVFDKLQYDAVNVQRTKGGKPYLANTVEKRDAPNFNFNVSHEGDFVVLASEPVCVCGVDVAAPQQLRKKSGTSLKDALHAFHDQLSPNEWKTVETVGPEEHLIEGVFQRHWSLKEAFVKARGDGLAFPLKSAEFRFVNGVWGDKAQLHLNGVKQERWSFFLQALSNGHWVSVARGPPEAIVDEWNAFKSSFQWQDIPDKDLKTWLDAPNLPFEMLSVSDLLPEDRLEAYEAAGGEIV